MPKTRTELSAIDRRSVLAVAQAERNLLALKNEIELAESRLHDYACGRPALVMERGLLNANAASVSLAAAFLALDLQAQQS